MRPPLSELLTTCGANVFRTDCLPIRLLVTLVAVAMLGARTPASGCCNRFSTATLPMQSCGTRDGACCCCGQSQQSAGARPKSTRACCMRSEHTQRPVALSNFVVCVCRPSGSLPPAEQAPAPRHDQRTTHLLSVTALTPVALPTCSSFGRWGARRLFSSRCGISALDRCIELGRLLI
jgi:hypothetical protein